ncbi:MAG: hypothetical protein C4555_06435 [Dehalococcoidia bacterium]|nr:MAG: hypothetical protein C4555_06435 [Dehalococcoidia bacterium]
MNNAGLAYLQQHRRRYLTWAKAIEPDLTDPAQVWERLAFSILSANAKFENAAQALAYARQHRGMVEPVRLAGFGGGITRSRALFINALPSGQAVLDLLKGADESWSDYRLRLTKVSGLGMAKASFAACLLYPLESEVCCLDIWMLKLLGERAPSRWRRGRYEALEAQIKAVARHVKLALFPAQWALWDHIRGHMEPHKIFMVRGRENIK